MKSAYFLLIPILIIGFAIRIYGLYNHLPFWTDSAVDLLITEKIWTSIKNLDFNRLPLIGPTANVYLSINMDHIPGINHGIVYYYFLTIPALFSNFNPYRLALFVIVLNILAIHLLYLFLKQISEEKTAILGSFLMAFSSYSINFSRISWNVSFVVFFILSSLLTFAKIMQSRSGYWPIFSVCVSILTQIHILGYVFILITFLPLITLRKVILPKGKLAFFSIFLFFLPQFPSIIVFFNERSAYTTTLIQYTISVLKDLANFRVDTISLMKNISSEFIFSNNLNPVFLSEAIIYSFLIYFVIIIFHLITTQPKYPVLPINKLYKVLLITWSCASFVILFLSKSHLERGNNYMLVFSLPIFIVLFTFLIRYAFKNVILSPFAYLILITFLYNTFSNIGFDKTLTLQDHKKLADILLTNSRTNPNYELFIPEEIIQESIFWVMSKESIPLPQRVNGSSNWSLPLTKRIIYLSNYPITRKYAVIYTDFSLIPPECLLTRKIEGLSLYACDII